MNPRSPLVDPASSVLGVGTDMVEVEMVRAALARRPGLRERIFTADEWAFAERHKDPFPHLAARFAAKEATMKALGQGMSRIRFSDVEVRRDGSAPWLVLHSTAASAARAAGVGGWHVSLTHTRSIAHAIAIAVDSPPVISQ